MEEAGLACASHICDNPLLVEFTVDALSSVPGLKERKLVFRKALHAVRNQKSENNIDNNQRIVPDLNLKTAEGYEMQDVNMPAVTFGASMPYMFISGFFTFIGLIALGRWSRS